MENGKRKTENAGIALSIFRFPFSIFHLLSFPFSIFLCLFLAACNQLEKPKPEPFYADAAPPARKEFRWSDSARLPKSFDPARAAAAPETDIARALFEGLTDADARTLKIVPAIAVDWTASDDYKTWTFKLRGDARWSNGERVTAQDFVRSWKRLAALGGQTVAHFDLLKNIVGMETAKTENNRTENAELDLFAQNDLKKNLSAPPLFKPSGEVVEPKAEANRRAESDAKARRTDAPPNDSAAGGARENAKKDGAKTRPIDGKETPFGAVALDDFTLRVALIKPDKDFPALVAHPVFRPVFGDGKYFENSKLNAEIVTSGAFRVREVSQTDGVTLERSENFWGKSAIDLERVRFVPTADAEAALEAYRAGNVDAVTNHDFEPLAQKLLTPFDDFERTTHGALNFYEFNRRRTPFDDRRVREALTISIERERLTQDEMDGASVPAFDFLPFESERNLNFSQNVERARSLLAAAGYANGEGFPVVRLVVNRNNVQQKIARAVAKMWRRNLNVETEIVVLEASEIEAARAAGDFDLLRRGATFATTDESANMSAIFPVAENQAATATASERSAARETDEENKKAAAANSQAAGAPQTEKADGANADAPQNQTSENSVSPAAPPPIENSVEARRPPPPATEADAVNDFAAVPLYFPTSLALVKPYVRGFEANTLDAPSLKDVSIDNDWKAK